MMYGSTGRVIQKSNVIFVLFCVGCLTRMVPVLVRTGTVSVRRSSELSGLRPSSSGGPEVPGFARKLDFFRAFGIQKRTVCVFCVNWGNCSGMLTAPGPTPCLKGGVLYPLRPPFLS